MQQHQAHKTPITSQSPVFKIEWISAGIDTDARQFMEDFGQYLCDRQQGDNRPGFKAMTTSQIRNVFSEVKRISTSLSENVQWTEWEEYPTFLMLRPKIAYNTARALARTRDSRMIDFKKVFDAAHEQVTGPEQFRRFMMLLEGIIAYHKVYGGKE